MFSQFISSQTSKNTQDAYRRNLAQFEEFVGTDKLAELTPRDLLNFLAYLREEGYSPASINQKLSTVKSFVKYLYLAGEVSAAAFAAAQAIPRVKETDHLPRVLTSNEVNRLLQSLNPATPTGARNLAFVQLALATGARLAELVDLNIEKIDWTRRRVILRGKGDKDRVSRFNQAAAEALVAYLSMRGAPAGGPVFVNEEGLRASRRYFQAELARCFERVGIEGASAHTLRHTHATDLLEATGDIDAVAQQLGHANIATTRRYTQLAVGRLDAVYARYEQQTTAPVVVRTEEVTRVPVR